MTPAEPVRGRLLRAGLVRAVAAAVAAAGAGGVRAGWDRRTRTTPGWQLVNYRGRPVSLAAGPALPAGALLGMLAAALGAAGADPPSNRRHRPVARQAGGPPVGRQLAAAGLAALGGAVVGRWDDLQAGEPKGLRGHLAALGTGRLTAGGVKLVTLPVVGLLSAGLAGSPRVGRLARDGAVVAVLADLVNLLDVRPGRAAKATLVLGAALTPGQRVGGWLGASLAGAAAALLPADLAERAAWGDCGANAAGALAGLGAVLVLPPAGRDGVLAAAAVLVLVSEAVPLSRVIDRVAPLRWVDERGRRGAAQRPARRPGGVAPVLP